MKNKKNLTKKKFGDFKLQLFAHPPAPSNRLALPREIISPTSNSYSNKFAANRKK